jgi:hypothetical protein
MSMKEPVRRTLKCRAAPMEVPVSVVSAHTKTSKYDAIAIAVAAAALGQIVDLDGHDIVGDVLAKGFPELGELAHALRRARSWR